MFGKPQWFRCTGIGCLTPASWQGWLYSAVGMTILLGPFLGLMSMGKGPEAAIWVVVALGLLFWDVRDILGQKRAEAAEEEVFVISEDTDVSRMTTEKYEFQLRDQ